MNNVTVVGIVMMLTALTMGVVCSVVEYRFDEIDRKLNILTETESCYEIESLGTIVCKKGEVKNEQ